MEGIKKLFGFKGDNDGSPLGFSDSKRIEADSEPAADKRTDRDLLTDVKPFADTKAFAKEMNKQLNEWLEKNVPMHMHEKSTMSPSYKLGKCLVCLSCIGWVVGVYKKDVAAMPTRKMIRHYNLMSGGLIIGFSYLLVCTYFQAGIFRPVTVIREPGDTEVTVYLKGVKKRLTPPEGSLIDRYIIKSIQESLIYQYILRNIRESRSLGKFNDEPPQDSERSSK